MSLRIKVPLALSLATLLAVGCTTVDQEAGPDSFVVATFDPDTGVIPLPNDLALQAAPGLPAGATRATLFSFIDAGGFPPAVGPGNPTPVAVPIRLMERDPATGGYAPGDIAGIDIDPATVNSSTVAIVRVSGAGAPEVLAPQFVGFTAVPPLIPAPSLLVLPLPALSHEPGTRYVAAVRGGPNGVKTSDGRELVPDTAIAIVRENRSLAQQENQPLGVTPAEAASLERLRGTFAAPLDWGRMPPPAGTPGAESEAICRAALGIPSAAPFPEQRCWLPPLDPTTGAIVPSAGIVPAFTAVELVFPVREAASIQTFEIAPAPL